MPRGRHPASVGSFFVYKGSLPSAPFSSWTRSLFMEELPFFFFSLASQRDDWMLSEVAKRPPSAFSSGASTLLSFPLWTALAAGGSWKTMFAFHWSAGRGPRDSFLPTLTPPLYSSLQDVGMGFVPDLVARIFSIPLPSNGFFRCARRLLGILDNVSVPFLMFFSLILSRSENLSPSFPLLKIFKRRSSRSVSLVFSRYPG